jgi:hypothetical protein
MASKGFRPVPNGLPPRGSGSGLRRVLRGFFEGAICEWASAPPRIALVAKSWGSLRVSSPARNLPLMGDVTGRNCRFVRYTLDTLFLYRGCRRRVYRAGSHQLELVTRLTAYSMKPGGYSPQVAVQATGVAAGHPPTYGSGGR